MSTPRSFDEYCAEHDVKPHELGQAFAAYLHEISGGEWDGRAEPVKAAGAAGSHDSGTAQRHAAAATERGENDETPAPTGG